VLRAVARGRNRFLPRVARGGTLPGLPGFVGTATVTHDGPYGALAGKAVALEPAIGCSFDTPLLYRPR
jgi:hypothetical protein